MKYYKTDKGLVVNCGSQKITIDGVEPTATFSGDWKLFKGVMEYKDVLRPETNHIYQWELIEDAHSLDLPKVVPTSDLDYHDDYNGLCINPEYNNSLYKREHVGSTEEWIEYRSEGEEVFECKFEQLGPDTTDLLENAVTYSELQKITKGPLYVHNTPCEIKAKQLYMIIQSYVKENIDPKYATVTSDYRFCFTVKKRLQHELEVTRYQKKKANGGYYAKPRYVEHRKSEDSYAVFEMTADGYRDYPQLKGMAGENLNDLVDRVGYYLNDLMKTINKPIVRCEHCKGSGVIKDDD